MRRGLIALALVAAWAISGLAAASPFAIMNIDPSKVFFADTGSVRDMPGGKRAWGYLVMKYPDKVGAFFYAINFEIDCQSERLRGVYLMAYKLDGSLAFSDEEKRPWQSSPPDTGYGSLIRLSCDPADGRTRLGEGKTALEVGLSIREMMLSGKLPSQQGSTHSACSKAPVSRR